MRGEFDYGGSNIVRGPSFGGVGHRMLIVGPHAAAAIIDNNDDNDDDDNPHRGGGVSCFPPLWSVLSHRTPLVVVDVTDRSQRRQHKGVWGVSVCGGGGGWSAPFYSLSGSDPTWGG